MAVNKITTKDYGKKDVRSLVEQIDYLLQEEGDFNAEAEFAIFASGLFDIDIKYFPVDMNKVYTIVKILATTGELPSTQMKEVRSELVKMDELLFDGSYELVKLRLVSKPVSTIYGDYYAPYRIEIVAAKTTGGAWIYLE